MFELVLVIVTVACLSYSLYYRHSELKKGHEMIRVELKSHGARNIKLKERTRYSSPKMRLYNVQFIDTFGAGQEANCRIEIGVGGWFVAVKWETDHSPISFSGWNTPDLNSDVHEDRPGNGQSSISADYEALRSAMEGLKSKKI